jgi:hypothetical protein
VVSRLAQLVVLLGALGASASELEPELGEGPSAPGRVTVFGGVTLLPNDHLAAQARTAGYSPGWGQGTMGPSVQASFGYRATPMWEVAIDLLGAYHTLPFDGADPLTMFDYGAHAALLFSPRLSLLGIRLTPYLGATIGPTLIFVRGGPLNAAKETLATGYSGVGGIHIGLGDLTALSLGARIMLARGEVPSVGSINGGGLWVGVGFTWLIVGTEPRPPPI